MKDLIIVRGGGDIATGTIYKLVKSGFHVLILEIAHPSAIRRNVAFSEAVYEGPRRGRGQGVSHGHIGYDLPSCT